MAEEAEDIGYDVGKLEGVEKAAILLLSLSEEDAAQILKHMEPKQVQKLGQAMATMDDMTQGKITAVHKHFIEEIQNYSTIGFHSHDFVKKALTAALGEDKAANLIDQILVGGGAKGLDSLKWMDSKQVAGIIRNEHPQIQTIVLAYLDPEQSAEILSQFPEKVRLDLMMRIANLEEVQPAALQELNEIMEKQFAGQAGAQAAKMGGLKAAADIMNFLDTNIEGQLMDYLRGRQMQNKIKRLQGHFVLCGYRGEGRYALEELIKTKTPHVVIDRDVSELRSIVPEKDLLYIEGDPTREQTLALANIEMAKGLISALPNDSENLLVVLVNGKEPSN